MLFRTEHSSNSWHSTRSKRVTGHSSLLLVISYTLTQHIFLNNLPSSAHSSTWHVSTFFFLIKNVCMPSWQCKYPHTQNKRKEHCTPLLYKYVQPPRPVFLKNKPQIFDCFDVLMLFKKNEIINKNVCD